MKCVLQMTVDCLFLIILLISPCYKYSFLRGGRDFWCTEAVDTSMCNAEIEIK